VKAATAEPMTSTPPGPRRRWVAVLLGAHDLATPEGRAADRHRRAALTAGASALAKVVSVGTALVSIPLTLHYLGAERFGLWMTISSLVALLAFADLGVANGVLNQVADAHGRDDRAGVRRAIASGLALLLVVAAAIVAAFGAAYPFIDWPAVFNVKGDIAAVEAGPAFAVFVACYAATIPLVVVQRAQMGLQQGFRASLWQIAGSLCGLGAVLVAIRLQAGLPWLVLALAGAPLLAAALNTLHFLVFARPDLRPAAAMVTRDSVRAVASAGALFFVLQLAAAVAYASDNFIIARLLGAEAVAAFAVPEKMFALLSMAVAMALAPLWPAYGEALARGDGAWVRTTLARSVSTAVLVTGGLSLSLFLTGDWLVSMWVGSKVPEVPYLLAALAIWKPIEAAGIAFAMFLNALGMLRFQAAIAVLTCCAAVALKILLIPVIGASGAVWGMIAAYVLVAAVPLCACAMRLDRFIDSRKR
jgi:O-antigen/teichoic acid export membrane protein